MLFRLIAAACLTALAGQAAACTVFAATGDSVEGGGTIVVKVRDEIFHGQTVKTVRPPSGYAYTGLFTGRRQTFNMGVNEKGLVVFRTTAGSVPKEIRRQAVRFKSSEGLPGQEFLIRYCASVDEALSHPEVFSEPTNYMMADATKSAVVEVLPGGRTVVKVTENGTLAHANHYILEGAEEGNIRMKGSSEFRLARMEALLAGKPAGRTLEDAVRMASDREGGPDGAVWRPCYEGSKGSHSLALMAVHLKAGAQPRLFLKWRDRGDDAGSWRLMLSDVRFPKEENEKY